MSFVRCAGGLLHLRVDGSKMTLHAANLLLEDLVPEPSLEFTLPQRRRRDAHSVLTTTKQDIGLRRRNGGTIEGCFRDERLENGDRARLVDLQGSRHHGCRRRLWHIGLLSRSYLCYW